jgi:hypothetical protein
MEDFLESFKAVVAIREANQFSVDGAWVEDGSDTFIWMTTYRGEGAFDDAAQRYGQSPERQSLDPDPASFIASIDARMLRPV